MSAPVGSLEGEDLQVPEVAKQPEVSEQTLDRCRQQYGGLQAEDAKRLKELQRDWSYAGSRSRNGFSTRTPS
jgi:hypothetical protein